MGKGSRGVRNQIPLTEGLGLYSDGGNMPPAYHMALAPTIVPLAADGQPDESNGIVPLVSVGHSNLKAKAEQLPRVYREIFGVPAPVVWVNGGRQGFEYQRMVDYWQDYTAYLLQRLAASVVTPAQVQIILLENSVAGYQPQSGELVTLANIVIGRLKEQFINLKAIYMSSAAFRGWSLKPAIAQEPGGWWEGVETKAVIESHLGTIDPWLVWCGYLWANGDTPRSDGITWPRSLFRDDGLHPNTAGAQQAARIWVDFFRNFPAAQPWFVPPSGGH